MMSVSEMAVHLDPEELADQLARDVRAGLLATPKSLPPKYFYDAHGSALFDQITRLAEYYPTRTESQILAQRAEVIAALTRAETLVELGSGTSEKTRLLLRALSAAGSLRHFVPFDVDPVVLSAASLAVAAEFPGVTVSPVVGDFEHHLDTLPVSPRRLVAFLGSTIGNLAPGQRAGFLADVRRGLAAGDCFLLGLDLVKSPARLVAAYDDAQGVTAEFNRNVLTVINRQLGADFDLTAFEHVALWDPREEWIEMRLRSARAQSVRVAALELEVEFAAGEEMRTEISAKFRRDRVTEELATAGLRLTQWWTDPAGDFALTLSEPEP
jgi:L-histidine Nalpha-methyltransferase